MFQSTIEALTMDELREAIAMEGLESYLTADDLRELEHLRLKFIYERGGLREMKAFAKKIRARGLKE